MKRMLNQNHTTMKKLFLILTIVTNIGIVSAQTIKRYAGPSDIGYLDYTYYEDKNGNRVRHGQYRSSNYKGQYSHGKRVGVWRYDDDNYSGRDYYHYGTYKNGILEGEYKICHFVDSDVITKLYIKDSLMVGDIFYRTPGHILYGNPPKTGSIVNGKTNMRGKAHGVWTEKEIEDVLFAKHGYGRADSYVYSREYFEGVLCRISVFDEATGKKWVDYSLPEDFIVALTESYNPKNNTFTYNGDQYQLIDYGIHRMGTDVDEFTNYAEQLDPYSMEILRNNHTSDLKLFSLTGEWGKGFNAMNGELFLKSPYSIFYNIDHFRRIEQEKIRKEQEAKRKEQEAKLQAKQHYDSLMPIINTIRENHDTIYSLYLEDSKNRNYIYSCVKDLYSSKWNLHNKWEKLSEEGKIESAKFTPITKAKEFLSYQNLIIEILTGKPKEIKKLNKKISKELAARGYPEITIELGRQLLAQ